MDPNAGLQLLINTLSTATRHIQISRYVTAAGWVIMVYDHMVTLPDEVELIWKKQMNPVSALFLFNRYVVPIVALIDLWCMGGLSGAMTDKFCRQWLITEGAFQTLCQAIAHLLACLRVRALLNSKRWVNWVLLIAGINYFAGAVITTSAVIAHVERDYAWSSAINLCFGTMPVWMACAWVPGLLFETILFTLLISKALQDWRKDISFPITRLLYRDGFLSYLVISSCSIFNIIAWSALPKTLVALAKNFSFCLIVTMSSRIVLNLRDLRRTPEDGVYAAHTDAPLELGSIHGRPRPSRVGALPTSYAAGKRDLMSPQTSSRTWTTSKNDGWDRSMPEMPPITVSVQVDVHREVEVDELLYDSDDKR